MFFDEERIVAMREMICADDEKGRRAALAKLLPMQKEDFTELFEIMSGLPVTIRLLDPPLHEFLPHTDAEIDDVAKGLGISAEKLRQRNAELHEFNPMLGFRGCRLAVAYPEIAEMQARAIFEAAIGAGMKTGKLVVPEIMVPLVMTRAELDLVKARIDAMAAAVAQGDGPAHRVSGRHDDRASARRDPRRGYRAIRRVLLVRHERPDPDHARHQSRRRCHFLGFYKQRGILAHDPFVTLDQEGVGELVKMAAERGRAARNDGIKLGICGEHGGDPASIQFCETVGLDYVSCSPYRVPIARLAAAQAALGSVKAKEG